MLIKAINVANAKKIGGALLAGMIPVIGEITVREGYKIYEAVDPMWGFRFKLGAKKRKKQFDNLMKQTNLKEELT